MLLADVFESFRNMTLDYYELDAANYMAGPEMFWDAILLKTNVKLELIDDLDLLDMIEKSKRGGLVV